MQTLTKELNCNWFLRTAMFEERGFIIGLQLYNTI